MAHRSSRHVHQYERYALSVVTNLTEGYADKLRWIQFVAAGANKPERASARWRSSLPCHEPSVSRHSELSMNKRGPQVYLLSADRLFLLAEGVGQLSLHLSHLRLRRLHRHEAGFELRTSLREVAVKGGNLAVQRRVSLGV